MRAAALAVLLAILPVSVCAQRELTGPGHFPHFRGLSGLSGGGYGLDDQGNPSLSGPTAFSTPLGYVLGHEHFRVDFNSLSNSAWPEVALRLSTEVAVGTFAHSFGRVNVAVSDMLLSHHLDQAFNLQIGLAPHPGDRLAASLGVQDIGGGGGSAGDKLPTDSRTSRSAFAAVTYRLEAPGEPIYLSGGAGTRRFQQGFVSVCRQVAPYARVWLEHDGFGLNVGTLLAAQRRIAGKPTELDLLFGLVKMRYFTFSVGAGF